MLLEKSLKGHEILMDIFKIFVILTLIIAFQLIDFLKIHSYVIIILSSIILVRIGSIIYDVIAESGFVFYMSIILRILSFVISFDFLRNKKDLPFLSWSQPKKYFCILYILMYIYPTNFLASFEKLEEVLKESKADEKKNNLIKAVYEIIPESVKLANNKGNSLIKLTYNTLGNKTPTDVRKDIKKKMVNKINFMVGFSSEFNIPLSLISALFCIFLGLIIIKLRFTRNYIIKLN